MAQEQSEKEKLLQREIQQILNDVAGTDPADWHRRNVAGEAIEKLIDQAVAEARIEDGFDYKVGQNVYVLYHDNGMIIRHKISSIQVIHSQDKLHPKRIRYMDANHEIPHPTNVRSWGTRPCSLFTSRKEANKASKAYKIVGYLKEIEVLEEDILVKQQRIAQLHEQEKS